MGQAKLRGRREDRVAQAKSKADSLRPEKLVCNQCKTEFTEFEVLDAGGMRGITAVFGGICPSCSHTTLAALGEPEAIAAAYAVFEEMIGKGGKIGLQKR